MTRFRVWLSRNATSARIADEAHRELSRTQRRLAIARHVISQLEADKKALKVLVACTSPAEHVRLAHRAEVAESLLAQRDRSDPHRASLRSGGDA